MRSVVVVGGSLAGHGAAEALREAGFCGDITVVGDEDHLPYDRWPLSEGYLEGELGRGGLDIPIGHARDVRWRLGTAAVRLDVAARQVHLRSGEALGFDGLVVATGARARTLSSEGVAAGTFTLRTIEDADGIRRALSSGPREVVVIGGGLIGSEVASVAAVLGHRVTLVTSGRGPAPRQLGCLVSTYVDRARAAAGVRVVDGSRAQAVTQDAGHTSGVVLQDGRWLPAHLVVIAVGTVPNVEWLRGSGLDLSNGLLCGPTLHAVGAGMVVGAGDVVRCPHPVLGNRSVRLEHWASTRDQAALAAANLLAGPDLAVRLDALPQFGTVMHGIHVRVVGFPDVADEDEVVRGSLESGSAVVRLSRGGQVVAAVSVNGAADPDELEDVVHGVPARA